MYLSPDYLFTLCKLAFLWKVFVDFISIYVPMSINFISLPRPHSCDLKLLLQSPPHFTIWLFHGCLKFLKPNSHTSWCTCLWLLTCWFSVTMAKSGTHHTSWKSLFLLFIYSHVHTLFGSFLHPAPLHHPSPTPLLSFRQVQFCPYH
jgi:hypothetical protein